MMYGYCWLLFEGLRWLDPLFFSVITPSFLEQKEKSLKKAGNRNLRGFKKCIFLSSSTCTWQHGNAITIMNTFPKFLRNLDIRFRSWLYDVTVWCCTNSSQFLRESFRAIPTSNFLAATTSC